MQCYAPNCQKQAKRMIKMIPFVCRNVTIKYFTCWFAAVTTVPTAVAVVEWTFTRLKGALVAGVVQVQGIALQLCSLFVRQRGVRRRFVGENDVGKPGKNRGWALETNLKSPFIGMSNEHKMMSCINKSTIMHKFECHSLNIVRDCII